jgi:integral membrane sensor domain MASE1
MAWWLGAAEGMLADVQMLLIFKRVFREDWRLLLVVEIMIHNIILLIFFFLIFSYGNYGFNGF